MTSLSFPPTIISDMKALFRFFAERHLLANVLTVMIFLLGIALLFGKEEPVGEALPRAE